MENYSTRYVPGSSIYRNHVSNVTTVSSLDSTFDSVTSAPVVNFVNKKAPHPFSYTISRGDWMNGIDTLTKFDSTLWTTSTGVLAFSLFSWRHVVSTNEKNALVNKALARLNDKVRGGLNLTVSMAEYAQVNRMISNAHKVDSYFGPVLKKLEEFADNDMKTRYRNSPWRKKRNGQRIYDPKADLAFYAKRGYGTMASILKMLGVNWLQWSYGFKPLVDDVYGIAENILLPEKEQFVCKIKAGAKTKLDGLIPLGKYDGADTFIMPPYRRSGKVGFNYKFYCKKPDLANPNRWASLNPAGIAWELLPFSFVVDWFYDIGSFLQESETAYLMGAVLNSGYSSYLDAQSGLLQCAKYYRGKNAYGHLYLEGRSSYQWIKFERLVISSWPFPRAPSIQVDLGTKRLLSAASLLSLHLRGK